MADIGHNQPSFDGIVEENLRRGMLLTQRDALMRCGRDPRCGLRHIRVLCEIIEFTNIRSGVAYPGRKKIAERTSFGPGDVQRPDGGYTEAVVAKTISELIRFGYLVQSKRAPETGGRAMSHYSLLQPSVEDLQREIESWVKSVRAADPRPLPDVTFRGNVRNADVTSRGNVTAVGNVSSEPEITKQKQDDVPDVTTGSNVTTVGNVSIPDVTTGVPTVTSSKINNNTGGLFGDAPPPPPEEPKPKSKRRTQIDPEWQPEERDVLWVKARWVASDRQIDGERDKFISHHEGKGSLMASWPAAWRTWWNNGFHKVPRKAGSGRITQPDGSDLSEILARMRAEDEGDADRL